MVFFITPRSVAPGSYALTELDIAQRRWRAPGGRVLPVLVEPTPIGDHPALPALGDAAAAARATWSPRRSPRSARMRSGAPLRAWIGAAGRAAAGRCGRGLSATAPAGSSARSEQAQRELRGGRAGRRGAAVRGRQPRGRLGAVRRRRRHASRTTRRCASRARTAACAGCARCACVGDKETFSALVGKIQPVLAQGLALRSGERRADLRRPPGLGRLPAQPRRRGRARPGAACSRPPLADDPGNVYAHAMWAHNLAWTSGRLDDEAPGHFADRREEHRASAPWLRGLQFSVAFNRAGPLRLRAGGGRPACAGRRDARRRRSATTCGAT